MRDNEHLVRRFEASRRHLRAVAYRMLGSVAEAEDAVQEAWLHVSRADASGVANLEGWLTTVTARVCLDALRSRRSRREHPVPEPLVRAPEALDPEHEAVLADAVGLALLVVLDTLGPAERVAFVLHDTFAVPFEEIAPIVDRTPAAARQLASRARRRVREAAPTPDPDPVKQRDAVDAFYAAARDGDFAALLAVLDPDVVLRAHAGVPGAPRTVQGAATVAEQAMLFRRLVPYVRPVLVNGTAGVLVQPPGQPAIVMAFTVVEGRIATVDIALSR